MEKADPCARSGVISFGSCSLSQILGTNGLVVVVVVHDEQFAVLFIVNSNFFREVDSNY